MGSEAPKPKEEKLTTSDHKRLSACWLVSVKSAVQGKQRYAYNLRFLLDGFQQNNEELSFC